MRFVVGVTGEIGAGKTAVARIMGRRGAKVVSLDELGHRALSEEGVKKGLLREFGRGIFRGNDVDRTELGKLAFADRRGRSALNAIVHPLMREWAREEVEKAQGLVALEGALLYEMGLDELCDVVVFVRAPEGLRLERLGTRAGWDGEELARRERTQMPSEKKSARADRRIANDGSEGELERKVNSTLEDLGWR